MAILDDQKSLLIATSFLNICIQNGSRGHFVFPIDAKNHRVLVIWDLNGYGEYEFDWCICDKVMACIVYYVLDTMIIKRFIWI